MKIALITSGLFRHTGGPSIVISNLIKELSKVKDLEILVVGIKGDIHPKMLDISLPNVKIKYFKPYTKYRFSLKYLIELIRFSPHSVWVHGLWLWPNFAGILYSFLLNKKLLLTPHGVLTKQMFKIRWYKKIIVGLPELIILSIKKRKLIHFLSDSERNETILNSFKTSGIIIPNFVSVSLGKNIKRSLGYLFLARIAPIKGIEDIIAVREFKCDVYGFGDEEYISNLFSNTKMYKGEVESNKVGQIFSEYLFYVLPSYGEGLPTSAIEAAMSGCILIISEECNLNMFESGVNCIKFKAGLLGLEEAIKKSKELTKENIIEMRRESLLITYKFFDPIVILKKYKKILE